MIRREEGNRCYLITQHDHALLAGELAARLGGSAIEPPADLPRFVRAVAMHDAGWREHDACPTRNPAGNPRDVFESEPEQVLPIWEESARLAEEADPLAGLLVSIHVLRLSTRSTAGSGAGLSQRDRFRLIQFQNHQAQRQMRTRERLGMRTDIPTDGGLAIPAAPGADDPEEVNLRHALRLLQAMDLLSLNLCCLPPPSKRVGPITARPGGRAMTVHASLRGRRRMTVAPWPFANQRLELSVPCRVLTARSYSSDAELHNALADAEEGEIAFLVETRPAR